MLEILSDIIEFIGEDQFFNLVAAGAATFWVWLQRKLRIDEITDKRFQKAKTFLEAGVAKTYQVFVKQRKQANADGKLTEEERKHARETAFSFAVNYAQQEGLDLIKELGADLIPMLLEQSVGKLKRECGSTPKLTVSPPANPEVGDAGGTS